MSFVRISKVAHFPLPERCLIDWCMNSKGGSYTNHLSSTDQVILDRTVLDLYSDSVRSVF